VASLDHGALQAWVHGVPRHAASSLRAALNSTPVAIRPSSVTLSALREHLPVKPAGLIEAVMGDGEVAAVIASARRHDHQFGLLVAVLAATGCRPSQVVRCRKADLLAKDAILVVPPSAKGMAGKAKPTSRMPLDPALVRELVQWTQRKPGKALLFTLPRYVREGFGWRDAGDRGWDRRDWADAARAAGIDRRLYDLRHAAIVRMILAGLPVRLIAAKLDTSTAIIERHYSRYIGDQGDELVRAAMTRQRLTVVK
jgi:integrase